MEQKIAEHQRYTRAAFGTLRFARNLLSARLMQKDTVDGTHAGQPDAIVPGQPQRAALQELQPNAVNCKAESAAAQAGTDVQGEKGSNIAGKQAKAGKPAEPHAELPSECPVCWDSLTESCMLSRCGHVWCEECHGQMQCGRPHASCPTCRSRINTRSVTRVRLAPQARPEVSAMAAQYGTKVEAAVLHLQRVLSEWADDKVWSL